MGVDNIRKREEELLKLAFAGLDSIQGVNILADNVRDRLGVISFYIFEIHYNLLVKLLNDRYGVQVRGGCACAGTYGHFLLEVSHETSNEITEKINLGDLSSKPGWVRWSLHPTTTDKEVLFFIEALRDIVENIETYKKDYEYFPKENMFRHKQEKDHGKIVKGWFKL